MIKGKPIVSTVDMPTGGTEYSFDLPDGTVKFTIKLRDPGQELNVCFASGMGTSYITLSSGRSYTEKDVKGSGNSLYFKCSADSQTAEIIYWK